jgi:Matrixin
MKPTQPPTAASSTASPNRRTGWNLATLCALALGAASASATSYVMVADGDLADQAGVIVQVEITAADAGPAGEAPATDYLAEIGELVKGYLPGSTIVVRVPGGVRADGLSLEIAGAPEFVVGEQALLFLEEGADGVYRPLHLMLGVFHVRRSGAAEVAVRELAGATRIQQAGGKASAAEATRDLGKFVSWLTDRAAGEHRASDYEVSEDAGVALKYSLLTPADGVPVRWFGNATWRVHESGQPGLTLAETVARFTIALESWNQEPNSEINLAYGGITNAARGFGGSDGTNSLTFNDVSGQVAGSFSCSQGGVVAMGGPYYYGSTRSYRGRSYHEAFEADIVTNDGSECYFRNNPRGTEEVLAHELGHTLGFGHSASEGALMWPWGHDDGRGVRFDADDCAVAALVYGDGTVVALPPPPAESLGVIRLTAKARSTSEILLKWTHAVKSVSEIRVEASRDGGEFLEIAVLPGGAKTTKLRGLVGKTNYAFRVHALRSGDMVGESAVAAAKTR